MSSISCLNSVQSVSIGVAVLYWEVNLAEALSALILMSSISACFHSRILHLGVLALDGRILVLMNIAVS